MINNYLKINPEVASALAGNRPVVALESTIISHGMPFPKNVETALAVEQAVRATGAIPATIALIDGKICIGLSKDEITLLGKAGLTVTKCSRRDFPFILSRKKMGATTVAATMIAAALAGIRVFATGGIGGVHREGQLNLDISADLQELARTNVAVISAGAKAILDLPLTLEYLETHGVPVVGYQTDWFPAFYTRSSGLKVDYRVDDPVEMAEILKTKWALGLDGGLIIGNPIPEAFEMGKDIIDAAIEKALATAKQKGIKGKELTPFLLAAVETETGGKSLASNIQLVLHNAKVAGEIARAYHEKI